MKSITLKKGLMGLVLFIIALFAILTPAFNVYCAEFQKVNILKENGFDFFDFESLAYDVLNVDLYSAFSILCFCVGIFAVIMAIAYFFVKEENINHLVAAFYIFVFFSVISYMILGILAVNDITDIAKEAAAETPDPTIISEIKIYTLAYIPFVICTVFAIIYFVLSYYMPNPASEKETNHEESVSINVSENVCATETPITVKESNDNTTNIIDKQVSDRSMDYSKLRELKSLLDDGILTQEEFVAEKSKILNSNK